jgi:tRNA threonylcarbamoyladenosine biosynthesis protein TsaE
VVEEIVVPLEGILSVSSRLHEVLPENTILFLRGDLAAGKTTLMKAIVAFRGLNDGVTSPTFSLQHQYGEQLYHYDLYRIDDEEFMALGLFEEFEKSGWHVIEWGSDRLKTFLEGVGYNVAMVTIVPDEMGHDKQRKYTIETP